MSANGAAGLSPQIRLLAGGERRLLADIGTVDPERLASYREHGGYAGLTRAVEQLGPEGTIAEIGRAGLRGRGGWRLSHRPQVARRPQQRAADGGWWSPT